MERPKRFPTHGRHAVMAIVLPQQIAFVDARLDWKRPTFFPQTASRRVVSPPTLPRNPAIFPGILAVEPVWHIVCVKGPL